MKELFDAVWYAPKEVVLTKLLALGVGVVIGYALIAATMWFLVWRKTK